MMIGTKFTDEVFALAQKNKHEFCLIHHVAKVLLTKFDEPRRILEESNLIDVKLFEELIDKKIKAIPKSKTEKPTYGSAFSSILAGATLSAQSVANVTELHLLTETVCAMVDEESDASEILSQSCTDPMELKLYVAALLGGTTVEALDREHQTAAPSLGVKASGIGQGHIELPAPLSDSFIGSRTEIDKLTQAANKMGGSLIALVGEKKSGKTTIVNALNHWMLNTNESVAKKNIVSLDVDLMLRTSVNRGVFEHYLLSALNDCKEDNSILLIDNLHYIFDACRDPVIMPLLARAADLGVTVISTITPDAYSKVFEKRGYNGSVVRINVAQPDAETRKAILRQVANELSNKAEIVYHDKAIEEISRLADIHLKPNELGQSIEILERCTTIHEGCLVTPKVAHNAVAALTGIELDILTSEMVDKLRNLKNNVKKSLFGQDEAVDEICSQIQLAALGFKVKDKQPRCSFMMLGSSGVGKTETTELIAKELGLEALVLNMGEYQEGHTISKLLGAPPGYLGWDAGNGLLAEFVSKQPNGIIVFDEIEKANSRIFDLLLGVLDKGSLTTNTQKEVDFSGITIFFTSNCGASSIRGNSFGLLGGSTTKETIDRSVFENTFRAEFRNRLTTIIDYKTLDESDVVLIANKSIKKVVERASKQYGVVIKCSDEAVKLVAEKYYSFEMGARPIERGVEVEIGRKLGEILLDTPDAQRIQFDVNDKEIVVTAK